MVTIDLSTVPLIDNQTAGGPIRVAFPLHSAAGTASSAAVLFELGPGAELARHTDSAEETLVLLDGEARVEVDGDTRDARVGHIAVVPAMAPHSVRNVGDDVLRVLGVFSSASVVATFEEPLSDGGPRVMVIGAPAPIAVPLDGRVPA
jgi:quercetin dioxygenase-like cupin family protein